MILKVLVTVETVEIKEENDVVHRNEDITLEEKPFIPEKIPSRWVEVPGTGSHIINVPKEPKIGYKLPTSMRIMNNGSKKGNIGHIKKKS